MSKEGIVFMKYKKAVIIGVIVVLAGLGLYKILSPSSDNSSWNEQMQTMRRSSGGSGRRSYGSTQDNNGVSAGASYYGSSSGYGQNTGAPGGIQDALNNAADTMQNAANNAANAVQNAADQVGIAFDNASNQIDSMINSMTGAGSVGTQLKWWHLVGEYNIGPQRILDEYGGSFLTVRDAVYDFGTYDDGDTILPYVVFERDGARAYMYFSAEHEDEVMRLTKAFPVTITGGNAAFAYNTLYLYGCSFGY